MQTSTIHVLSASPHRPSVPPPAPRRGQPKAGLGCGGWAPCGPGARGIAQLRGVPTARLVIVAAGASARRAASPRARPPSASPSITARTILGGLLPGLCAWPQVGPAMAGGPHEGAAASGAANILGVALSPDLSRAALVPPLLAAVGFGAFICQKVGVFEEQLRTMTRVLERLDGRIEAESEARRADTAALGEKSERQTAVLRADMEKQAAVLRADMEKQAAGLRTDMEKQAAGLRTDMEKQAAGLRADTDRQVAVLRADVRALDEKFDRKLDRLGQDIALLRGVRTEQERLAAVRSPDT